MDPDGFVRFVVGSCLRLHCSFRSRWNCLPRAILPHQDVTTGVLPIVLDTVPAETLFFPFLQFWRTNSNIQQNLPRCGRERTSVIAVMDRHGSSRLILFSHDPLRMVVGQQRFVSAFSFVGLPPHLSPFRKMRLGHRQFLCSGSYSMPCRFSITAKTEKHDNWRFI